MHRIKPSFLCLFGYGQQIPHEFGNNLPEEAAINSEFSQFYYSMDVHGATGICYILYTELYYIDAQKVFQKIQNFTGEKS